MVISFKVDDRNLFLNHDDLLAEVLRSLPRIHWGYHSLNRWLQMVFMCKLFGLNCSLWIELLCDLMILRQHLFLLVSPLNKVFGVAAFLFDRGVFVMHLSFHKSDRLSNVISKILRGLLKLAVAHSRFDNDDFFPRSFQFFQPSNHIRFELLDRSLRAVLLANQGTSHFKIL